MRKLLGLLTIVLFAGAVCALADDCGVPGNVVLNCGFELNSSIPITDWTFTPAASGSDFYINTSPVFSYSGNNSAAFGSVGSFDDSISQTLATTLGDTYYLSFYLYHEVTDSENDFNAYWDGTTVYSVVNTAAFGYTHVVISGLVGTGSDTLEFAGREVPSWYFLDNVSVSTSTIPEPATVFLFGTGLIAVVGLKRFRERKS